MIGKSVLNPHFKGFGAITRSDSCRVLKTVHFGIGDISKCWMDDHFVKILVFFTIWSTNGSLLGVHQWFLWVNQWFLWVNQWFPCWGEPMAPLFGWTNGSLVGEYQWLPSGHTPSGCAPLRGAPPGPGPLELEGKKLGGKSVPENYIFFKKTRFSSFYLSKRSETYLVSQILSRGSGSDFSYPKLIGDR